MLILLKCPSLKNCHASQFGFTDYTSTIHATFMVKETINYYNKHGSPVYICSLDAEKAFDGCNWNVLFTKLYKKGIPSDIINVIKNLYIEGTSYVLYNGTSSHSFRLSQGVRQGSVLSPHLYNIYTENVLDEVNNLSLSTTIGDIYTGIVA